MNRETHVADLGDPQALMPENVKTSRIGLAREAVKHFVEGEVAYLPAGNEFKNKILDTLKPGAGNAEKAAVSAAATECSV